MPTPLNGSLLKGFDILSLFSRTRAEISAHDVVAALDMNQATAHRFLLTLEKTGAIRSTKRGYYALGEKIDELSQIYEDSGAMAILIQPELDTLSRSLKESVMACRLTKSGPACVAVANSSQPISVNIAVGTVLPFLATAQGKLWLAEMDSIQREKYLGYNAVATSNAESVNRDALQKELEKINTEGYATNMGSNEPDIAAISVAVRQPDGKMILSLSAFGLLRRFNEEMITNARNKLRETAVRIGKTNSGQH